MGDADIGLNAIKETHQKIRFGRGDVTPLRNLPSGAALPHALLVRSRRRRLSRALGWLFSTFFIVVLLILGAVYLAGISGLGSDRLRLEASRAISAMVGFDVRTELGKTRLTLDKSRLLALEVTDVEAVRIDTGEPLLKAGYMRFGIRFNPLLNGEVRLGNAMISDARMDLAALPESEGPGWASGLMNEQRLIEPDMINERLFAALHSAFNAVAVGDTRNLALSDVEVVIGRLSPVGLHVDSFEVDRPAIGHLDLKGEIRVDNRAATITGSARRNLEGDRIEHVELSVEISDVADDTPVPRYAFLEGLGAGRLLISGSEGAGNIPSRLDTKIDVDGFTVKLEHGREIRGAVSADASLVSGTGKVEINAGRVTTGRSAFDFNGAVGPMPAGPSAGAAYRYEFVSNNSTVAPLDSPEPALPIVARLAGEYDPEERRLTVSELGIRTDSGEMKASAAVEFKDGISPGLRLSVAVPELPVWQVKQLWPFFAAPGARRWVLNNLFGGRVLNSRLQIDVAPGGFGDGIAMTAQEGFGHFEVEGSRFDVAGTLPPVRDSVGMVDFRGTDVDIFLSSGTVFMGNDRRVAASNGTLTLRNSHLNPLIGNLAIEVAGEAPAIVELASYEPISVSRFIDLPPDKVSGTVTGKVVADIPFQKDVLAKDLSWNVALDFKQLALDKEFEGQKISEAEGTLLVDPTRAEFVAKGRLNGIPAEISLLEPFGESQLQKRTDVALIVDEAARDALFPGLKMILAGSAKVKLASAAQPGRRLVTADLRQSVIKLPWVGWSKGAGVPAEASFTVAQDGDRFTLTDFRLKGESFGASGSIDVRGGSLAGARFNAVRLNRGDDFAVDVAQRRGGYDIKVNGKSLDARSVVKLVFGDGVDGGGGASEGDDTPVTLAAKVEQVRGFGGEVLSGVDLDYSTSGSGPGSVNVSGTTSRGVAVSATDRVEQGRRTVAMRTQDAGSVLRFLDIYERMHGGSIDVALSGSPNGALSGRIDARNFEIVNEPRLASVVSSRPAVGQRSLSEAVNQPIDVSRASFERGYATVEKGKDYLRVANGVLKGQTIGMSFRGLVRDANNNIDLAGTFMPAYGINRIFGDIPLVGAFLGNGRDGGLIGITFRLIGKFDEPQLRLNPISAIAPGIFRSIFEFR